MSVEDLASQLEALSEELGEITISRIRDALEYGGEANGEYEKKLAQARRAVDKAAHVLRELPTS